MLGDVVDDREVKDPPMSKVPLAAESVVDIVEFDQQSALMIPPVFVLPNALKLPSEDARKTVSPSTEKEGTEEVAAKEDGDHQSRPAKDPPNPTVPIREKSTCGKEDGAGVPAMAGSMNGAKMTDRYRGRRLPAMLDGRSELVPFDPTNRSHDAAIPGTSVIV